MQRVNFTDIENRIEEILERKDHKNVKIKEMWLDGQKVVVNLGYKKEQRQVTIPVEYFDDKLWLEIEKRINYAANRLKQETTMKPKKKQERDTEN